MRPKGVGNVIRADGTGAPPDPGGTGDTTDPAPSAGCGSPARLTSGRASIEVAGQTREYILRVPENYDQDRPYRLIFGWHPWGGSAQQIESRGYFGLESVVDGQAVLDAPEGREFQATGSAGGTREARTSLFCMRCSIASARSCDRLKPDLFHRFQLRRDVLVHARMFAGRPKESERASGRKRHDQRPCEDGTRSVATMAFIGTDDTLLAGHRRAVDILIERNGCSTQATTLQGSWCDGLGSNNQPCTCVEYPACKPGYPVISCEYQESHQFAPESGATLWSFFSQF